MTPVWGDLNARVRGLGTRLLPREELTALALSPDLPSLATALARNGFPVEEANASSTTIELGVRRRMAELLRILGRWCGPRSIVLGVLFDDEDRRSVRALVHRVGTPSEETDVSALLPTPSLPERALSELARQPTIRKMAGLLSVWGHPYGPVLAEVPGAEPDLLDCEMRINRAFAARALRGALRAGRRGPLLTYVREVIDIENAYSALVLSVADPAGGETVPDAFLEGGSRVGRDLYQSLVTQRKGSALAASAIAKAFAGSTLAAAFPGFTTGGDLERAVLDGQISEMRAAALRDPLGPAPVVHFVLRVRQQLLDLQRVVWGVALNAPRGDLTTAVGAR